MCGDVRNKIQAKQHFPRLRLCYKAEIDPLKKIRKCFGSKGFPTGFRRTTRVLQVGNLLSIKYLTLTNAVLTAHTQRSVVTGQELDGAEGGVALQRHNTVTKLSKPHIQR